MTSPQPPTSDLFCPVCGTVIERIWVWQETGSDRARIFCDACAARPEYASLSRLERWQADVESFNVWAGQRQLRHVFEKEHPAST